MLVWLFAVVAPPFLALCAVIVRKVWASMARVMMAASSNGEGKNALAVDQIQRRRA